MIKEYSFIVGRFNQKIRIYFSIRTERHGYVGSCCITGYVFYFIRSLLLLIFLKVIYNIWWNKKKRVSFFCFISEQRKTKYFTKLAIQIWCILGGDISIVCCSTSTSRISCSHFFFDSNSNNTHYLPREVTVYIMCLLVPSTCESIFNVIRSFFNTRLISRYRIHGKRVRAVKDD
jgi:hypothetical protein